MSSGNGFLAAEDGFTIAIEAIPSDATFWSDPISMALEEELGSSAASFGSASVSDTASMIFEGFWEGISEGVVEESLATFGEDWPEIISWLHAMDAPAGQFAATTVTMVNEILGSMYDLRWWPWWMQRTFSTVSLDRSIQVATVGFQTVLQNSKYLMSTKYMPLLIKYAGELLTSKILRVAAGAGVVVVNGPLSSISKEEEAKIHQDMVPFLEKHLANILLHTSAKVLNVTNVDDWVTREHDKLFGRRRALKRSLNAAMSTFTRVKGDKSPLPKEWGSFGLLECKQMATRYAFWRHANCLSPSRVPGRRTYGWRWHSIP